MLGALTAVFCLSGIATCQRGGVPDQNSPRNVHQSHRWVSANVGESVSFKCWYDPEKIARIYWYGQKLGERPTIMAAFYQYNRNGSLRGDYRRNPRFALVQEGNSNYLKISDVRVLDSGTYYCAVRFERGKETEFEFAEGSVLAVKRPGSEIRSVVRGSGSGGSLTLNCTFQSGGCGEEPGVYWFGKSEAEADRDGDAGVVYTHGGEECVQNDTAYTCVYHLPPETPPRTLYCAVAACGHILFGNGTTPDFEDGAASPLWWCSLGGAFAVAVASWLACIVTRRRPTGDASTPRKVNARETRDADMTYFPSLLRSERGDQTWSECVYYCKTK